MKDLWIAAIARGHNASVCLMHNGKIVFSIEEERLSRFKYDGGPLAAMIKIKEYTDHIDYLLVAHTMPLSGAPIVEYTGDNVYSGLARKLGLMDRKNRSQNNPNVIDFSNIHHKLHAACAFYRSGFDKAAALVVDGAGTYITLTRQGGDPFIGWETETIFDCQYPMNFKTVYKHVGVKESVANEVVKNFPSDFHGEVNETHECVITDRAGIVKTYEAVTQYCGFHAIEAGKTMGLFPYGKPNSEIPPLYDDSFSVPVSNRNFLVPNYPANADVNYKLNSFLNDHDSEDITKLKNRRDLAYACQIETQEQVLNLILKAVETSGKNKVVLSGGYALNCVANYFYLTELHKRGIELYVEPVSNDGGTAIGAALVFYHMTEPDAVNTKHPREIYLGPQYNYSEEDIERIAAEYDAEISDATKEDVVNLMTQKNIVAMFQGRSENGPRALGNRSLMFDPTFEDGKDFVNEIKHREYFRPFAGSILEEDVHEWFDLRGMPNSPHMMYAVNCQPGIEEKIPSIIHVDGTCRIQTVTREENPHYYDVIKAFKDKTGVPIIFNTSFNLGGEPLVETLDDALWTLSKSGIDYLYLPEYNKLLTVKIKK